MNNLEKPLIDWLTYRSYEANRNNSPHIPDYKWRAIYQDAILYEEIYDNYVKNRGQNVSSNF